MGDPELLRDYLATGSERAFAELVDRYIDLVYSAARRQVRDTHLAEDIAQAVFIVLARKAGAIRNPAMLGAWLIKTTRQTSYNAIRFEHCRRRHEQEAATMNTAQEQTGAEPAGANIDSVVDELLARLGERDRGAIVLRYLQDKSVDEVAAALRISPPAAQKRITRALSRLKNLLAGRGIVTAGAALEQGLCSQVRYPAPPGLALRGSSGTVAKSSGDGAALLAQFDDQDAFLGEDAGIGAGACLIRSGCGDGDDDRRKFIARYACLGRRRGCEQSAARDSRSGDGRISYRAFGK